MVDEAVDHGGSDDGAAERFAPAPEGFVGGDDDRGSFLAGRDQLEELVGGLGPEGDVADLEGLEPSEFAELWDGVRRAITAIKRGLHPDGVNMGANLGEGAGPSVPDHVHVHVVPRWRSDTNFMSAVADVRVLPQGLSETWELLREAWPDD